MIAINRTAAATGTEAARGKYPCATDSPSSAAAQVGVRQGDTTENYDPAVTVAKMRAAMAGGE
ncbi:hypothetical protein [Embleya sp. MST-111070]|uniref:hypothetical protein n=1 Tax=Embleya sp. MST-111070 TaxID=3398231 RepID=UPI003F73D446